MFFTDFSVNSFTTVNVNQIFIHLKKQKQLLARLEIVYTCRHIEPGSHDIRLFIRQFLTNFFEILRRPFSIRILTSANSGKISLKIILNISKVELFLIFFQLQGLLA